MNVPPDLTSTIRGEAQIRFRMLCTLYRKRCELPTSGVMTMLEIQVDLGVEADALLFASWYLRNKKLIIVNDRSMCSITPEGIDFLEGTISSLAGN